MKSYRKDISQANCAAKSMNSPKQISSGLKSMTSHEEIAKRLKSLTFSSANHVTKGMNSSHNETSLKKIMQAKTGNLMRKFPT
jgi:hypothetical protein